MSHDLEVFAAFTQSPFPLNDAFTFTEVLASGQSLFIRVDTSAWFVHADRDRRHYLPVFCGFAEVPEFLARGAKVIISIHELDGTRVIEFTYAGSDCDG